MFFISMPRGFKIGNTADCRINKKPARVTWRDADHLVIEPGDARRIITVREDGDDLLHFVCGDAGARREDYGLDDAPSFGGGCVIFKKEE